MPVIKKRTENEIAKYDVERTNERRLFTDTSAMERKGLYGKHVSLIAHRTETRTDTDFGALLLHPDSGPTWRFLLQT